MIERDGDVFSTDATYIGHGVNCAGVMGAGIAKTIREKFPQTYLEYKRVCETGLLKPGSYFPYHENGKVIVNFASQNMPGPDAQYPWLFTTLYRWAYKANNPQRISLYGNKIAIPEIGCGIGGLEWPVTKMVIETVEAAVPGITFELWHYVPNV